MDNTTFINRLAATLGRDAQSVGKSADALASVIARSCSALDSVAVPAFGTFSAVKTDEHIEPGADGRLMLMPPYVAVEFTASAVLKKHVANG